MNCMIVGAGFGAVHSTWLRSVPGVRIGALIYNADRARAERLRDEHGIAEIGTDLSAALKRDTYDLVTIVSPPRTHVSHLRTAVEAGVTVVLEKPLADTQTAAREIEDISASSSKQVLTFFQWRLHPAAIRLRQLCIGKQLGQLRHACTGFEHDFLASIQTLWPWRHRIESAGAGSLGDMGVHLFDLLRATTGLEWQVTTTQTGITYRERTGPDGPLFCTADDFADVRLTSLEDGVTGRVSTNRTALGCRRIWVRLYGQDGAASLAIDPDTAAATLIWVRPGGEPIHETFAPPGGFNPYIPIIAHLRGEDTRAASPATVADGMAAQSLMNAALGPNLPLT